MYEPRDYRQLMQAKGFVSYNVTCQESDLQIFSASRFEDQVRGAILSARHQLMTYMAQHPDFEKALVPLVPEAKAPDIIKEMCRAGSLTQVGPMAAVAGAIAKAVGDTLDSLSPEYIIENGGDLYLRTLSPKDIAIYAGDSPFSNQLAIRISPQPKGLGVCTSSGQFGHSLSFGKADAVVVLSENPYLADAAATALCNAVQGPDDVSAVIEQGKLIPGICGLLIIAKDALGLWGDMELVPFPQT